MARYVVTVEKDGQRFRSWQLEQSAGQDGEPDEGMPPELVIAWTEEEANEVFEQDLATVLKWFNAAEMEPGA